MGADVRREQERQSKAHSEQSTLFHPPAKLKGRKLVLSVRKCLFFWTPQEEKKEYSQGQVFNENSVPKGSKMGETSTQSQTIFHVFAQRWKKSMTILGNTFMVTVTQDDSKMQNGGNMHT